jgi:hypothetical protein
VLKHSMILPGAERWRAFAFRPATFAAMSCSIPLFHQINGWQRSRTALAVTVDSTIAGILGACSSSDSARGALIAGAACAARLGSDRAVLFWDSAVNDSLKFSRLIKCFLTAGFWLTAELEIQSA